MYPASPPNAHHDVLNRRAELEMMLLHDKRDAGREVELGRLVRQQGEVLKLLREQALALQAETDALTQEVKPAIRRARRAAKPAGAGQKRG